MDPAFRRSLKNRLVDGGGRPVLLGQRNRMRMRSAVAMGVAVLPGCRCVKVIPKL